MTRRRADLVIEELQVRYRTRNGWVPAVRDVSFTVPAGRTVGLVGESGSGKSSLAKAVTGLVAPSGGSVTFAGEPIRHQPGPGGIQMIFQDPVASLHPHRTLIDLVAEPLRWARVPRDVRRERAAAALADVGLDPALFGVRRPHQISGGQAQRVAIARAALAEPDLIVADEPVASLDVSVQAGVVNLLHRAVADRGASLLFISHDIGVVSALCDEVVVLYLGRICEYGPTESVLAAPAHPYTRALLDAVPEPGRVLPPSRLLAAEPPSPSDAPPGCAFHPRCPDAVAPCRTTVPATHDLGGVTVSCHVARSLPIVSSEPIST
ncbi:ABC transporter ATP-binding protein [Pseudonocardia kongjuensis]|uniref:ABC transporter ATP-binding protein n=1 Tax=Pseudonocardia kongjuensis TaxID=102227 RepID=A0ABN1XS71_9PSEU